MDRREFLKLCAMAGVGLAAPIGLRRDAYAEEGNAEGPYYMVINATGGWDTTYLMDPKGVNDINALYREGDILTQGPHRFAPTAAHISQGMSNEAFFAKYGDQLLTLNGLDYSINNHRPGERYMATGTLDSLAYPTFAALVSAIQGSDVPLAFISFGSYANTANLVPISRIGNIAQVDGLTAPDIVRGNEDRPYHEDAFVQERIEQALAEDHELRLSGLSTNGRGQLPRVARSQSMLYTSQLNSRTLSRIRQYLSETQPALGLSQQAHIALAGFKAGVSVAANLSLGRFDSHADNDVAQLAQLSELLGGIDYAVERAEELGIRDKVVFVIQSEMGRTPWYNWNSGKDHWSVGSIMFMGPNIRGNRVIGSTDDGQFLTPIDPATMALDAASGIHVRPEHLHLALREYAGIEGHALCEEFSLRVEPGERLQTLW